MTKNKNINISPSKGISIIIKNDFQQPPPIKPKKKRKYKRKVNTDLLKMPTMPSYIPGSGDVSYIKPQYAMSSLNRNMIFPGVPQSLPQLTAPPQLPQLPAPPPPIPQLPAPPVNFNFDGSFGKMLENMMMPREYGYKSQSYAAELDEDVMDALPPQQQDKYIEKQIKPQIEEQLKDIEFDNEADKSKVYKQAVSTKTAKEWGTKHANQLKPYDIKYKDNDYYKQNYISRLHDIINQDTMKTRGGNRTNTTENKEKAKELLKAMGIKSAIKIEVPVYIPPPQPAAAQPEAAPPSTPPRSRQAQFVKSPVPPKPAPTIAPAPPAPPPAAAAAGKKPPAPPAPPPAVAAGKGPPPPPPPPPKPVISTALLDSLGDSPEEKAAKEKAAKEAAQAAKTGSIVDELKTQQEKAPKQAGTKNGKSLSTFTEKYIDNLNYRTNYKKELENIRDNEKSSDENKEKAKELLKTFNEELIKRAKEYADKDTNIDTLYPLRPEYKEFDDEYTKPYIKKMKKYLEETTTKYKEEETKLKEFQELNKQENRKTLDPAQKKKLTQKLEESEKNVKTLKELIDKITEYSGLK